MPSSAAAVPQLDGRLRTLVGVRRWHPDVDDGYVGPVLLDGVDERLGIAGRGADLDAGLDRRRASASRSRPESSAITTRTAAPPPDACRAGDPARPKAAADRRDSVGEPLQAAAPVGPADSLVGHDEVQRAGSTTP